MRALKRGRDKSSTSILSISDLFEFFSFRLCHEICNVEQVSTLVS